MINVFHRQNGQIAEMAHTLGTALPDEPVWIDLLDPTPEEERTLPQELNIALPKVDEMWRNHALNRMYSKDGISYMNASVIHNVRAGTPNASPITFILTPEFLITIRRIDPSAFLVFQENLLLSPKKFPTSADILEGLLEDIITRMALKHEQVISGLEDISKQIFVDNAIEGSRADPTQLMRNILKKLGFLADLNSKINETLHSQLRLLSYFKEEHNHNNPSLNRDVERLIKDCRSLSEQTDFLSAKITFHLDTALGMVNVDQNLIYKVFSVVALIFLPPTLVAGIYGMNFRTMPELNWDYGYLMALIIMGAFSVIPYWFFKRKGWL
jgi:magnesium transporter